MGHISFADGMKTQQEYGGAFTPKLMEQYNIVGQGLGAEMIADQWEITRHELDELAVRSHRNAARATDEGLFEREIVPFQVNGDTYVADQGIRPDTNLEALSQLKPAFKPDGKITAGNSSQISDGAAAMMLTTPREGRGARPQAAGADRRPDDRRLRPGEDARGPDPRDGEAAGAQRRCRSTTSTASRSTRPSRRSCSRGRASTTPTWTASTCAAARWRSGTRSARRGARLITTLLHTLEDEDKEIGLVTMCCGGGLGTGTIIQRV